MFGKVTVFVEGLSAYRAADKLHRAGICILSVKKTQKKGVTLEVARKDLEKVFAILQGSCYNITKVRPSASAALAWLRRGTGFLLGALCAVSLVCFAQTRVLAVRVTGSGSYYEREVCALLEEQGIGFLSKMPADGRMLSVRIFALPRVSFCSVYERGGVLVVQVEVSDEQAKLSSQPLCSPADGVVRELTVVRGNALVQAGEEVQKGQTLVDCLTAEGFFPVIARAVVACPFSEEYAGTEEEAYAALLLAYGEVEDVRAEQTSSGWKLSGTALFSVSLNFG